MDNNYVLDENPDPITKAVAVHGLLNFAYGDAVQLDLFHEMAAIQKSLMQKFDSGETPEIVYIKRR